jgi:hypothetical protein
MPYAYNNTAQRWFDTVTGKFVSETAVVDEMRIHQQATYNVLENATRQLYAGQLTLEQWQIVTAHELKDAHLAQAMFAVGGKRNMTQENWGRVGGALANQYRYLDNFANEIAAGNVSLEAALARINLYGDATQASYWREYKLATKEQLWWNLGTTEQHCGRCPELAAASPYNPKDLNQVPGDGNTPCLGHCDCTLSREEIAVPQAVVAGVE